MLDGGGRPAMPTQRQQRRAGSTPTEGASSPARRQTAHGRPAGKVRVMIPLGWGRLGRGSRQAEVEVSATRMAST